MSENGRDYWDARVSMTPASARFHSVSEIITPYEGDPLPLTIFLSCCDEEATITDTLETIREAMDVVGLAYEVLVIDDASTDGSAEKIRRYMDAHADMAILLRSNHERKGLAQNYYDGAFIARGQYYRLVRGDNSEPVETMADVLRSVGEADIVVPYFISMGQNGPVQTWAWRCYTAFLNMITGNRINDYTGLHVHLRYNVMRWHCDSLGFSFQADLLCRLLDMGFTCKQVPCRAPLRRAEKSLTFRNLLSLLHTTVDIISRRFPRR